jgi:membrane-bound lytic murein transglycosylase A
MHSVAVDKKCIPYGAFLLAEVPILDENGVLAGKQFRILFAHDTGGAIRGPGHLDLYHGEGKKAGNMAGDLHHYGQVWLLLPKK